MKPIQVMRYRAAAAVVGPPVNSYAAEVLADAPIAYWHLDETSGTIAADAIGTNNGTYAGTTLNQAPLVLTGRSVLFSGSGSGVTIPDAANLSFVSTAFSIECWVKTTSSSAASLLAKDTTYQTWPEYNLNLNSNGTVKCDIRSNNSDTPKASATTSLAINDGNSHHVVAVFVPSATLKIYVDGVERASVNHSLATSFNSPASLRLGRSSDEGSYLVGYMDEVALYASALSAQQVQRHYNAGHI